MTAGTLLCFPQWGRGHWNVVTSPIHLLKRTRGGENTGGEKKKRHFRDHSLTCRTQSCSAGGFNFVWVYYLFNCYLVSFKSEPVCLNSVIQNRLLMAELLLVPLSPVGLKAGSCRQDAGFLLHLQQRGHRVVVLSGSRRHAVVHRACQRSHSLCDPAGETTTAAH